MSQSNLSHYIPRRLDDPSKFLFWELDVAAIGFVGLVMGVLSGFPILGLGLGVSLAFYYSKLKAGKHPGMLMHLLYWLTGFIRTKALPDSHLRELNG
jgi:conjugal transfer pilus assembly protein TraL